MSATFKFDFDKAKCKAKYDGYSKQGKMILKNEIVKDTDKFVPMQSGFVSKSAISSISNNSDTIVYKGPYARFLYEGKVMIGIKSHSPWARSGEVKIVTNKALTYSSTKPLACARWFQKSKSLNQGKWIRLVKKVYK